MLARPKLHGGAGRSTMRRYKKLHSAWRRRYFGRSLYALGAIVVGLLFVATHVHGVWLFMDGAFAGGIFVMIGALGDLAPDHIRRKERGAYGEQWTASELRCLKRRGWTIRHDVAAERGNYDHIVAGGKLYLLDTKNWTDSRLEVADGHVKVVRLDDADDWYHCDRLAGRVAGEAIGLSSKIRRELGIRVFVNAVVVVWAEFRGPVTVGNTTFVNGHELRDWLTDLPGEPARPLPPATLDVLRPWVRALPDAKPWVSRTDTKETVRV